MRWLCLCASTYRHWLLLSYSPYHHRDDDEAFSELADRLEASSENADLYPAPTTPEAIALMEKAIREHVQKLEEKRSD
jgi:hypothetical protein